LSSIFDAAPSSRLRSKRASPRLKPASQESTVKDIDRRLAKLESKIEPKGRFICTPDTPETRALLAKGFMPDNSVVPALYRCSRVKGRRKAKLIRRRLGKRDVVVLLSEAEMAL